MTLRRRDFVAAMSAAAATQIRALSQQPGALGIPGPYPGRVVAVSHQGSIVSDQYQAEPVRKMMQRGMAELTGADSWVEAWRRFFEPGDVVGIKLNPVGMPHVVSAPEVLHSIIDGLEQAGIKRKDIVAYDRYHDQFLRAGFDKWLPEGVRWMAASPKYLDVQLDMDGYDPDVYMEMALVNPAYAPEYRLGDPHVRRSYVAKFLTKEVNKLVNLCVLKHHQTAGVTLALKNLSHGCVNNVNRSHTSATGNATGVFIPSVVDQPIFREKVVLNILDGVKAGYHGGPGGRVGRYAWEHKTIYFATDPVALDKTGWKAIDEKRAEAGLMPIALSKPDADSRRLNCQVEHIELAGNLGLGVFDDKKLHVKRIQVA